MLAPPTAHAPRQPASLNRPTHRPHLGGAKVPDKGVRHQLCAVPSRHIPQVLLEQCLAVSQRDEAAHIRKGEAGEEASGFLGAPPPRRPARAGCCCRGGGAPAATAALVLLLTQTVEAVLLLLPTRLHPGRQALPQPARTIRHAQGECSVEPAGCSAHPTCTGPRPSLPCDVRRQRRALTCPTSCVAAAAAAPPPEAA